ncbi:bifunctional phosphopantothenoylcysteine decarboxylase/phosphopantothenate--cysteine ligase CoaBC [Sedimenticola selenatireducens]|uniref:Coenzyme A biosynthesis bifunctional protein CoaBC n=1 Tax=Sedimenticola selenatireducens TaxID=191960 RepID=A0A2N6CXY8_9GAMM|nr:bifunctional phosphopantothenoylcysteine decarboxylase/phosphopantothenate--cysteine ligase CoaBC [Sedimenticola selenatireducens]PLX62181.1 MAG: bifunctional phosphopantothenoylcysteine decarboxylase/phosphopantothenate--cysteine ligase CoaBC [Sedimenticola selenatireducens]
MNVLAGKKLLLGVTGGIAAYKSVELVRLLRKSAAEVQVVLTGAASQFVTPMTLQAVSGRPVRQDLFDPAHEAAMGHIELARWADLVLVAPASASFMARLANGFADNLLSTLCLATAAPIVLAPAMNQQMWQNAATRDNASLLVRRGVELWGPASGDQACGEVGPGRMLEPEALLSQLCSRFTQGPLAGVRVLLTAGPTREPLDPVRFIGNRSSGKMGFALARAFTGAGARVELIAGPVTLDTPAGVERVDVETAGEMEQAVMARVKGCDIFVGCAAVADYRPDAVADQKIKKNSDRMEIRLVRNADILAGVAALPDAPFTVGFAAETQDPEEYAEKKRIAKRVNMIAANLVGARQGGFERDENALTLIWEGGREQLPMTDKVSLAEKLVSLIAEHYENRHSA